MQFAALFWNIWLDNQLNGKEGSAKLLDELRRLCQKYNPDVIGLNEVLQGSSSTSPFVHDFLRNECGYSFSHFAPASDFSVARDSSSEKNWTIGTGFCSKVEPSKVRSVVLCSDAPAKKRGQPEATVKAIAATLNLGAVDVNYIVAHPPYLRPYTLKDHYEGTRVLESLLRSEEFSTNTVLGGDFNEPDYMPKSFKSAVRDIAHTRTGSKINTTWRHKARQKALIRANLDQLYWTKDSAFSFADFRIIETNVSDHRPLVATFNLPMHIA